MANRSFHPGTKKHTTPFHPIPSAVSTSSTLSSRSSSNHHSAVPGSRDYIEYGIKSVTRLKNDDEVAEKVSFTNGTISLKIEMPSRSSPLDDPCIRAYQNCTLIVDAPIFCSRHLNMDKHLADISDSGSRIVEVLLRQYARRGDKPITRFFQFEFFSGTASGLFVHTFNSILRQVGPASSSEQAGEESAELSDASSDLDFAFEETQPAF